MFIYPWRRSSIDDVGDVFSLNWWRWHDVYLFWNLGVSWVDCASKSSCIGLRCLCLCHLYGLVFCVFWSFEIIHIIWLAF
jgi:hypothetical protein